MPKLVTAFDLDIGIVTIDVPHGDLVVQVATALGRWSEQARRLAADLVVLRADGVFLDGDGQPVVPGWWERRDGDRRYHYLVWPTGYARRSGTPRREYVRVANVDATRARVQRTLEYSSVKLRHDRLMGQIGRVGDVLTELVTEIAPAGANVVTNQGMVTETGIETRPVTSREGER